MDSGKAKRRSGRKAASRRKVAASDGAAGLRRKLEKRKRVAEQFLLRLYVTGTSPASQRAIERVRELCEKHLQGRCQLEVIDIYQLPALAKDEQIIATPTLIKVLPAPLRRFIGDLSKAEKTLFGLDFREAT